MNVIKWGLLMKFWKACDCGKTSSLMYGLWLTDNDEPDAVICIDCFHEKVRYVINE